MNYSNFPLPLRCHVRLEIGEMFYRLSNFFNQYLSNLVPELKLASNMRLH